MDLNLLTLSTVDTDQSLRKLSLISIKKSHMEIISYPESIIPPTYSM